VPWWLEHVKPRWITACVLFLMTFTLDSRQFFKSLRKPGPVILAGLVNLGFLPLLGLALAPSQLIPDFQVGLMIAASVPCTLAAASVWTRKAGGNDAVSLLVTLTTNTLCVIVTPFWVSRIATHEISLDLLEMTLRLVVVVLIPTIAGQLLRLPRRNAEFATHRKVLIGVVAQGLILVLVLTASMKAGLQLSSGSAEIGTAALLWVWACCLGLHLAGMMTGWWSGKLLGMELVDRKAIIFAASQKTLPIGVLLATDPAMFGAAGVPFAIFPMLMYHSTQLIVDTLVAQKLSQMKENNPRD
jgi:sodium/bile acid cotransporter 7